MSRWSAGDLAPTSTSPCVLFLHKGIGPKLVRAKRGKSHGAAKQLHRDRKGDDGMDAQDCKDRVGMWCMALHPDGGEFPVKITAVHAWSANVQVEWGKQAQCVYPSHALPAFLPLTRLKHALLHHDLFGSTPAERAGNRLLRNLRERIAICDELTKQDLPLPCFPRNTMQRLTDNQNELDELIAEMVTDLLNERAGT